MRISLAVGVPADKSATEAHDAGDLDGHGSATSPLKLIMRVECGRLRAPIAVESSS